MSRSRPEERECDLHRHQGPLTPAAIQRRDNEDQPTGERENAKGSPRRVLLDIGILCVEEEIVSLAICRDKNQMEMSHWRWFGPRVQLA